MSRLSLDELRVEIRAERGPTMAYLHRMRRAGVDIETLGIEWWQEMEGRWTVPDGPDPENRELLEVLLCPSCDMELYTEPCSPVHALLQDNPLQHRLLLPLMEAVIKQIRHDETKLCTICFGSPPIATGDCPHVVDRWGQVWMSKKVWEKLTDEVKDTRRDFAEVTELHDQFVEAVSEERARAEEDKRRWAADWAMEKFERAIEGLGQTGDPSATFQREFEHMLKEDL